MTYLSQTGLEINDQQFDRDQTIDIFLAAGIIERVTRQGDYIVDGYRNEWSDLVMYLNLTEGDERRIGEVLKNHKACKRIMQVA